MEREWAHRPGLEPPGQHHLLTVMQWNLLSQSLGVNGDFQSCPTAALSWEHRAPLLVKELLKQEPDILCLEEVDCFEHLATALSGTYSALWAPKPSSPCLKFEGNIGPDGNAIFYRKSMFEHVKSFHQILNDETKRPSNATVLVCQLEHRGAGKPVTVMATHLKAKQGFEKTRAAQATHLLEILKAQRAECVILAGDFNAGLEERVYPLVLAEGLASAYAAVQGREPPYTTWKRRGAPGGAVTGEKKDTIDFIFFRPGGLQPRAVASIPPLEAIGEGLLPSARFPSDHMSLLAQFALS